MFNEAENVEATLRRGGEALASFQGTYEIVAVNDGSLDHTLEILGKIQSQKENIRVVSYSKNMGRGMALRKGFQESKGEMVVSIDADLSYDPRFILDLIDALKTGEDIDLVLASPYMPGGRAQDVPVVRLWISQLGNRILRLALPNRVYTSTGIFRAYRRHVLDSLELESNGKEIHLEVLSKAMALGFRLKEVPVTLQGRERGRSKFKFKKTMPATLKMALDTSFAEGSFPLLSANTNLDDPEVQGLGQYIKPYTVRQSGNVKVGIFALTTPATNVLSMPAPAVVDSDFITIAAAYVDTLVSQGCSLVICLSHLGLTYDQLLASYVPGTHAIVGGHDHYALASPVAVQNPVGDTTWIVQANAFYLNVGKLRLTVQDKVVRILDYALIPIDDAVPEEPTIAATVEMLVQGIEAV